MSGSKHPVDPKKAPVPFRPRSDDGIYQSKEWSSGTRGGGFVPKDFVWGTSPKQHQEERGSGTADAPISK
jgi:hypothetical protein